MYVKLLFGPFEGEVKDLANEAALQLLALGQAARAFQDPDPEPLLTLSPVEVTIPVATQRKGRAK